MKRNKFVLLVVTNNDYQTEQTIAARISPNVRQPGQPRLSRAATIIAASANGSAKTVCEKRTNEPHF